MKNLKKETSVLGRLFKVTLRSLIKKIFYRFSFACSSIFSFSLVLKDAKAIPVSLVMLGMEKVHSEEVKKLCSEKVT